MKTPLTRIGAVLAVIAVIAVAGLAGRHYWGMIAGAPESGVAAIGGPFALIDEGGRTVTEADFRGQPLIVYFGYTYCPDVCPTTLTTIAEALDLLGDKGHDIAVLFITVDPERDRPENVGEYARVFHPQIVGLTGTTDQVAAAARAYRVYFAKAAQNPDDPEDYLVDHSAYTYLMGRDGKFLTHFPHGVSAKDMAERITKLL
jgi:protein SCO1/2